MSDLVSPITDNISRLWPCCTRHTSYLCKLQENKILLRNAMDELKEKRDEVQRRVKDAEEDPIEPKMRTEPVGGWLQRVENIESEVEKILEKKDEHSRGICLGGCCLPKKCWKNYKLGKSVVIKMASVDELKRTYVDELKRTYVDELKGNEHVTYLLPPPSVEELNLDPTVGMESMFDKVWRLVVNKDDKVTRIMGLYGQGGVGKTTLLEKINDEFKKTNSEHGFDHVVIFMVVSKPINYEAIQNKIGERLGLSDSLKGDGDETSRSHKIFNKLRNKNFVILLDDIWDKVDLRRIGIPSPLAQCNSSKVIFTTRNKQVCGLMEATHTLQVECLPWDKAWSLFQNKIGEDTLTSFPGACELAKLVAKECDGLPLALIAIGRAMSTKKSVEEWKHAITTLKNAPAEFEGMSDKVLRRLKLSYDYLCDETMKSCFLYCALFPEDYSIEIAQLIDYWIGEGFLNCSGNLDEARSHGRHVIETLKRACLLESDEYKVKMHDIIRDLALWIVNDGNTTIGKFLVASDVCERWRNAERVFWTINDAYGINNEAPVSPNLRTLMVVHNIPFYSLPQSFFQFMLFLRVLDFSKSELRELPTSICQLSELQYLGLSGTYIKTLPVELRKLAKLKFLMLYDTYYLRKIPPGMIATFSELQVLDLSVSGFKDWELKEEDRCSGLSFCELNSLKQLGDLRITINTSLALDKLLCNQKLRMICTELHLELKNRVNVKSVSLSPSSSSISKGLGNLPSLKRLAINDSKELEELILFVNINDRRKTNTSGGTGMLTNNKLEYLCLYKLPRLNNILYHHYLHEYSPFQNLHVIHIHCCDTLKDLTWLVYMENLKELYVYQCDGLETIIELDDDGFEEARGGSRVFGRLNVLVLYWLPSLKSICRYALAFPSIETIDIYSCRELKKLPLDSGSNINNTLEKIKMQTKLWNELEWGDETIKSKFLPYYREVF